MTNLICTKKTCPAASLFVCKSFSIITEIQVAVNCYSAAAQLFRCISVVILFQLESSSSNSTTDRDWSMRDDFELSSDRGSLRHLRQEFSIYERLHPDLCLPHTYPLHLSPFAAGYLVKFLVKVLVPGILF